MENCCNCTCAKENHCKRVQWLQTDSPYICAFQMPWTHFVKTSVTRNWRTFRSISIFIQKEQVYWRRYYNNLVVEHLENKNAYVRSVFIDFSSAFNTLKPDIVINKLRTLNVSPILCKFILYFLTNREQRVRINDIYCLQYYQSVQVHLKVVYSLLYCLLYTQTNYDHVLGIVIWSNMLMIQLLSLWFQTMMKVNTMNRFLKLFCGVKLTICCWMLRKLFKELIFDFRHCNISHVPLFIDNSIVEICDNFKYLGITFDCKLKWSNHCTLIVSKCKQRLFFLRLLNSFGVKNDILHVFYTSMIESIICYNISLWWSSMNENDKKTLNRITKQAANGIQSELSSIGQFHVTTDTTQKNKSSYAEYLVLVLYCTHIKCHGFKGNIQIQLNNKLWNIAIWTPVWKFFIFYLEKHP